MSAIPPNPVTVICGLDASAFEAALNDFAALRFSAPKRVSENLVSLRDVPDQLFRIGSNDGVASAAGEVVVRLEPTDFFLRLLAALRAGDWDRLASKNFLDLIRHDCISVGGLEPASEDRAPAESQGSVGACPGNAQRGDA